MSFHSLRWVSLASILVLWTAGRPAHAQLAVHDVVSGLICGRPGVDQRVCFATSTIYVTGEGRCVYDGRDVPCTWFGVSFHYDARDSTDTLTCKWTSSYPVDEGNPGSVRSAQVSTGTLQMVLLKADHYHFEPLYAVLPTDPRAIGMVVTTRYSCASAGHTMADFTFEQHYPER